MRNAFAAEVTALAAGDPRVVLLAGDIGNRLFDSFKARFPDRFYNCGVAEANMIGVAAGLAMAGMLPVAYTIAPFITSRCLEQIRVDLCYHDLPVTIAGVGAGLSYASLGPTHHSCEDIAMLRALPNMAVVCPGDPPEVGPAVREAVLRGHPTYLRLGKKGEKSVHPARPELTIGKAITVREGRDVCLLSTGTMLPEVMALAGLLAEQGVSARVASFHTVKPLDEAYLAGAFREFDLVVTVEEHGLIGGFGAAVAEWRSDRHLEGAELLRFGSPDTFLHEAGGQGHARRWAGLDAAHMAERIGARLPRVCVSA
jgi:transketolase